MTVINEKSLDAGQRARLVELADVTEDRFVVELLDDFERDGASYAEDIRSALAANDLAAVRLAAHSLKSMAYTLGFDDVGGACEGIEGVCRQSGGDPAAMATHLHVVAEGIGQSAHVREAWLADRGT